MPISVFEKHTAPAPSFEIEVSRFAELLSNAKIAATVQAIRKATKDEQRALKNKLPAVTFGGTFTGRKANTLSRYSGLVVLDFDALSDAPAARDALRDDKHVMLAFVSPTGTGLKVVVPVGTGPERHRDAWESAKNHFQDQHGLVADKSGKDINRLCYVSHDPARRWNPEATPLPVPDAQEQPALSAQTQTPRQYTLNSTAVRAPMAHADDLPEIRPEDACAMLAAIARRGRLDYPEWLRVINAMRAASSDALAIAMLKQYFPEETPGEYEEKFAHPCERIGGGTLVHMAEAAGFDWKGRVKDRRRDELKQETERGGKFGPLPPAQETRNLPPTVDAADLLNTPHETPPELIEGLLHQASKLVLGSDSKSGKTWTILALGVAVATGTPWMGRNTKQGRVLFVDFELQPWAFRRRLRLIQEKMEVSLPRGTFTAWNLRGHAADAERVAEQVVKEAQGGQYALIICDPVYKLLGDADENSAGDVAKVLNSIERVAVQTGAAVALVHHFAKGNGAAKRAVDRFSGSGVWARDPDSLIVMTRHKEADCYVVESTLRNFPSAPPFVVRWQFPLMVRADDLDPAELEQPPAFKKSEKPSHSEDEQRASIRNIVPMAQDTPNTIPKGLLIERVRKSGMSRDTATTLVEDMLNDPESGLFEHQTKRTHARPAKSVARFEQQLDLSPAQDPIPVVSVVSE